MKSAPPNSRCLTTKFGGRTNVLYNDCQLAAPWDKSAPDSAGALHTFKAIWDTGATGTVITLKAAQQVGLIATGQVLVRGVHDERLANTYIVNVVLPSGVLFEGLVVTEGELGDNYDMLIGMDIIGAGDFAVSHVDNKTVMTFRIPSCDVFDFVRDVHAQQQAALIKDRPAHKRRKHKRGGGR